MTDGETNGVNDGSQGKAFRLTILPACPFAADLYYFYIFLTE